MDGQLLEHISAIAEIPSFSSYEERLHPYLRSVAGQVQAEEINVEGNSLLFRVGELTENPEFTIAFAAHLDKNNHYGEDWNKPLEVKQLEDQLEGAMDDSVGLGICARLMEWCAEQEDIPPTYFLFSEMEESMGLKEHPEWMKNNAAGLEHGMGAKQLSKSLIDLQQLPDVVITVDTTPLFKGDPGIALYARHWALNDLEPTTELQQETMKVVNSLKQLEPKIKVSNNTNDYLHYGYELNQQEAKPVVSVAIEPAIYPYHQAGERVFYEDMQRTYDILCSYINQC